MVNESRRSSSSSSSRHQDLRSDVSAVTVLSEDEISLTTTAASSTSTKKKSLPYEQADLDEDIENMKRESQALFLAEEKKASSSSSSSPGCLPRHKMCIAILTLLLLLLLYPAIVGATCLWGGTCVGCGSSTENNYDPAAITTEKEVSTTAVPSPAPTTESPTAEPTTLEPSSSPTVDPTPGNCDCLYNAEQGYCQRDFITVVEDLFTLNWLC